MEDDGRQEEEIMPEKVMDKSPASGSTEHKTEISLQPNKLVTFQHAFNCLPGFLSCDAQHETAS